MTNKELIKRIRKFRNADLCDAMDAIGLVNTGTMSSTMRPIRPGITFAGFAFTIKLVPAQEQVKPCRTPKEYGKRLGEWCSDTYKFCSYIDKKTGKDMVVVVDMGGYPGGLWGSEISMNMMRKGVEGVVLDGGCRDSYECNVEKAKVFCTQRTFNHVYGRLVNGGINVPVQCAGVSVNPGDVVCGDDDGILVIPRNRAEEVLKFATPILEYDQKVRAEHYQALGYEPDETLSRIS
jgi:4-hydroxy-4-methyl-2-oxoglutarate aldolase